MNSNSKNRWAIALVAGLIFLAVFIWSNLKDPAAAVETSPDSCNNGVSTKEWHGIYDLGDESHSPRRSVIEDAWDVDPVGYRNEYWQPASSRYYSYAYNFCQNPDIKIVIVYRRSSGAWQYALKGGFA